MMSTTQERRGYVLLTTLWIVVVISTALFSAMLLTRQEVGAAVNRMDLARLGWRAEGCLELALRSLETNLWAGEPDTPELQSRWVALSILASHVRLPEECLLASRPGGERRNVNDLDLPQLRMLLHWAGVPPHEGSVLAASLLDWSDLDTAPRIDGAERAWYLERNRIPPRDGPFGASDELDLVRGSEWFPDIRAVLGSDSARLSWRHASIPALASLPGMTNEAVSVLSERRRSGQPITDLATLMAAVPDEARDSLDAHATAILARVTAVPEFWVLSVTSSAVGARVQARLDAKLVLGNNRLAVLQLERVP